jgi:hypothetical protein
MDSLGRFLLENSNCKQEGSLAGLPCLVCGNKLLSVMPPFHLEEFSANVQPKSSIPIGPKLKISHKGLTLGVEAEIEKNFSIAPRLKKDTIKFGRSICYPWGQCSSIY